MELLAIIPARGGSKGMPRKNVKPLAGTPLIVHTIQHALQAPSVTRTLVSTDDPEIGVVSRAAGAEVLERPAEISGDMASSESALRHALDRLEETEGYQPDAVVFLQCTSPIRTAGDVEEAIALWRTRGADSLVSVTPWHGLNWIEENGEARSVTFDYRQRPRRQDMREEFRENGSIFIFTPALLRETGNRLGGQIVLYTMDPLTAVETDTPDGFVLSEGILPIYHRMRKEAQTREKIS